MRSHLLTLSCLLGSSGVCAAAPASLIADLPDVGDEGEDEDFLPIGDGPGGGGGGYVYEGEMMEYGMWDDGMDDGYYDEPEDVEELLRHLFSRFDANRDEHLDVTELRAALQAQAQEYQAVAKENAFAESEQILQQADEDGDGKLDEAEFGRMETLYLQHEHAIGRRALFLFADGGEGPSGGGDGLVEASELQVLIFPESHPRGSALSRLMAAHVLKEHDVDGNGRVDKAELFAFHKKGGLGQGRRGGWDEEEDDEEDEEDDTEEEGGGWREARRGRPVRGGTAREEHEYAAHNETFDWHDKDGDGHLDPAELEEYVLPRREHAGYVEEELQQLLMMLRQVPSLRVITWELGVITRELQQLLVMIRLVVPSLPTPSHHP